MIRDAIIQALWLSPTLKIADQLTIVFQELHLPKRASRCMNCGGELVASDKEKITPMNKHRGGSTGARALRHTGTVSRVVNDVQG